MLANKTQSWPQPNIDLSTIGCHSKEYIKATSLWRLNPTVRRLALSPALAGVAATLMGVPRVRLYSDAVYLKQACDKYTKFHRDLDRVPLNAKFGTLWIPLTEIDRKSLAPLIFVSKSHLETRKASPANVTPAQKDLVHKKFWEAGRKLTPPQVLEQYTKSKIVKYLPLSLGDATFHDGWLLHGADHNREKRGGEDRMAIAISYVEDGAILEDPDHEVQPDDKELWSQFVWDLHQGEPLEHELLPCVSYGCPGVSVPKMIVDPTAMNPPPGWDEEDDGPWEPPMIENPEWNDEWNDEL